MIVSSHGGELVEASHDLDRRAVFTCPACSEPVTLKAGRVVVPHFAHRAGAQCAHGQGETEWHRMGKALTAAHFRARAGYRAEFEVPLGDRRTDLLVTGPTGERWAFEFQRKDIADEIEERTADLLRHVARVYWVLPWDVYHVEGKWRVTASPMVRAAYAGRAWRVAHLDTVRRETLFCALRPWPLWVERRAWWEEQGGEWRERDAGGYWRKSKRWAELVIERRVKL